MPVDPRATIAGMTRAEKNIRFGIARGLTQTAKDAQAEISGDLPKIFDRPTPFTKNAVAIQSAKRDNLTAVVLVKDVQAKYLLRQETGGVRTPVPGSPINLPVQQRTNAYGNIARGAIAKQRTKKDVFVSTGKGPTKHLPPGLYQRPKLKKSGRKPGPARSGRKRKPIRQRPPKLLVAFEKKAVYRPRFGFAKRVEAVVKKRVRDNIARSIAQALATAR